LYGNFYLNGQFFHHYSRPHQVKFLELKKRCLTGRMPFLLPNEQRISTEELHTLTTTVYPMRLLCLGVFQSIHCTIHSYCFFLCSEYLLNFLIINNYDVIYYNATTITSACCYISLMKCVKIDKYIIKVFYSLAVMLF